MAEGEPKIPQEQPLEQPLQEPELSPEEREKVDADIEQAKAGDESVKSSATQPPPTEEPQFSPEFQEILAEKEKMLEQIRGAIQEAETDLKTINDTPELSADPAIGNKIRFSLEGLMANLNALRSNVEDSHTKGSLSDNAETLTSLSREHDELRKKYQEEYDRVFPEETTKGEKTPPPIIGPEPTAKETEKIDRMVEEAWGVYQQARSEGALDSEAKAKATDRMFGLTTLEDNSTRNAAYSALTEKLGAAEKVLEEKIEQPRPEITPEIIKETALKVREIYRDALDTGATEKEAAAQSQTKLNELTANKPGFRTSVLKEIQRARTSGAKPTSPENLPAPSAVEDNPVETLEERNARLGEMLRSTEADPEPIETEDEETERLLRALLGTEEEKKTRIDQENEMLRDLDERRVPEAPPELVSETAREGLVMYQKIKAETDDAIKAFETAREYINEKLKEYQEVSSILSWLEMSENIPDLDFPPEPEPTPEEKEQIVEAKKNAAEVVAEVIEKASETEPTPAAEAEEIPEALKPIEAQETAPGTPAQERIQKELAGFNITPEQIAEIPGFNDLSEGRQLLVIENLKQITLGRIQEEANIKFKTDTAQANAALKIFRFMFRKGYEAQAQKETAENIIEGGLEKHKDILAELVNQADVGPEAEVSAEGKLEIQYLNPDFINPNLTDEEKEKIKAFNQAARTYAQTPYAQDTENWDDINNIGGYRDVLDILLSKMNPGEGVAYLNDAKRQIALNQFLNTNPEVDKALQNIQSQNVWTKALSGTAKERLALMAGGFGVRTAITALLGVVGAPVTIGAGVAVLGGGAIIGGYRAYQRTKESQKESEQAARHGQEKIRKSTQKLEGEKGKTISQFVKADQLIRGAWNLISETTSSTGLKTNRRGEELTPQKRAEQLHFLAEYIKAEIKKGTINFGATEIERIKNQYELIEILAMAEIKSRSVEGMNKLANSEQVVKVLEKQKDKSQKEKTEQLLKKTIQGGFISGIFAYSGYVLRAFGEEWGWWGKTMPHVEKPDLHLAALEKGLGINSKDGLDQTEFSKIAKHLAQLQKEGRVKEFDDIRKTYGWRAVIGTGKTVEETLKDLTKHPAPKEIPIPESAPKMETEAEPLISVSETKPSVPGFTESILPALNKAETIHEGGNVWNTTRDILLYRRADELKELGFDVPHTDPQFGEKLSHWADAKTSELLNQYANEHGGKMPDLVHEGDKVLVEFKDGKLGLKVLDSHGNELEAPSVESELPETKPEQPPMSDEETKALEEKLQRQVMEEELPAETPHIIHPLTGEDLGPDPHPELQPAPAEIAPAPKVELPQPEAAPTSPTENPFSVLVEKTKEALHNSQNPSQQVEAVKNYLDNTVTAVSQEKLNTFAQMFPIKGVAERIEDIDTLEELAQAMDAFSIKLHNIAEAFFFKGGYEKITPQEGWFPVESADGNRIYFLGKDSHSDNWLIKKFTPDGKNYEFIRNPDKTFMSPNSDKFGLKELAKFLGYKLK